MANPFLVQPAQYGPAMQQAAGAVDQFAQKQYMDEAKQAMASAFQSQDPMAIRDAVMKYPEIAETATQMFGFTNDQTEQVARETYRQALSETDPQRRAAIMEGGIETVSQFGGNPRMMSQDLRLLRENPEAFDRSAKAGFASIASDAEFEALFPESAAGAGAPARIRAFNALVEATKSDDPEVARAAKIELQMEPGAGTLSADQRTALDEYLRERVTSFEREKTAAKEEGKLETQAQLVPGIRASIKEAEQQAQSRGEAASELSRAEAALPGLQEVVGKLVDLSDVATYTWGGRAFDTAMKELGFGATEGSTARAKMESLVNNQILPLLRDTFGAQFTEKEGESLKKTMLDINAAPAQKREILNSFLEQKMRDIETKRARLEGEGGEVEEEMSDEEADAYINQMLEQ